MVWWPCSGPLVVASKVRSSLLGRQFIGSEKGEGGASPKAEDPAPAETDRTRAGPAPSDSVVRFRCPGHAARQAGGSRMGPGIWAHEVALAVAGVRSRGVVARDRGMRGNYSPGSKEARP
jgi:hypothetical protein